MLTGLSPVLAGGSGPMAPRQDAEPVRRSWEIVSGLLGEDSTDLRDSYAKVLEQLLAAKESDPDAALPPTVIQAFGVPWMALRLQVEQRQDAGLTDAFRMHAAALQECLSPQPRRAHRPGKVWQVPADGALDDVYRRASFGDRIEVQGRLPKTPLERTLPRSKPFAPLHIVGPATLVMNPVGGSSTLSMRSAGYTLLERLDLELDDTAAVMFGTRTRFRGIHFKDCRIGLAAGKGWNAETDQGFRGKWGVLSYELDDFLFEGGEIVGVDKEHCFYHHNPRSPGPNDDAIVIRGVTMKWAGRTAVQVTSRRPDGPDGRGNVTIEDCVVEDVCLESGGGGSALTFRGNLDGTVTVRNSRVVLGGNPRLHPSVNKNITGALVMDAGKGAEGRGTRELVIEGCHFEVGPYFVGKGSARRSNVNISKVERCTIRNTTILNHPGAHQALHLDGASIGRLILDPDNDIRGDCVLVGLGTFEDPERDGSGWRALLQAVEDARELPEDDPRRVIADKVVIEFGE